MSGVKGRSGRRPLSVELKRLQVIDKAWARVEALIDDKLNKFGDVVAKDVATKTIPQQVENLNPDREIIIVKSKEETSSGNNSREIPIKLSE